MHHSSSWVNRKVAATSKDGTESSLRGFPSLLCTSCWAWGTPAPVSGSRVGPSIRLGLLVWAGGAGIDPIYEPGQLALLGRLPEAGVQDPHCPSAPGSAPPESQGVFPGTTSQVNRSPERHAGMKAGWAGSSWPSAHSGGWWGAHGRAPPGVLAEAEDCAPFQGVSRGALMASGVGLDHMWPHSALGSRSCKAAPAAWPEGLRPEREGFRTSLGGVWAPPDLRGAKAPEEEEPTRQPVPHAGAGATDHGGPGRALGIRPPQISPAPSARSSVDRGLGWPGGGGLPGTRLSPSGWAEALPHLVP